MTRALFTKDQTCPLCGTQFRDAERAPRYEPVLVFHCPGCSQLLWKPGLDAEGAIFAFDPNADEGGI